MVSDDAISLAIFVEEMRQNLVGMRQFLKLSLQRRTKNSRSC